MSDTFYYCTLVYLTFGLVYGNQCEKKNVGEMGCPVFQIDTQNHCRTYMNTNDGEGNFVFYINPLSIIQKWQLFISLNQRYSGGSSKMITQNLFSVNIDKLHRPNLWYKIKIRRGKATKTLCIFPFQCEFDTYFLEVNDQKSGTFQSGIEAGNEIRVKTVSSYWSFTCDPRLYQPPPQPTEVPHSPSQLTQMPIHLAKVPLQIAQPTSTIHVSPTKNVCEQEDEIHIDCPIYKLIPHGICPINLQALDKNGTFGFFIKSFEKGNLSLSIVRRINTQETTEGLFNVMINEINKWNTVIILNAKTKKDNCKEQCIYNTYFLKFNDQEVFTLAAHIEPGNELLIQTSLTSMWSLTCDPAQFNPTPQSTVEPVVKSHASSVHPVEVANTATTLPIWQIGIIAGVSLIVILATVIIFVLRHRRRKCDQELIQPTRNHQGISRHVSDNSLYESYGGSAGRGLGGHITNEDNVYEEIDPQGTSTSNSATDSTVNSDTNSDTNSAYQRRGSAHVSENSLYMGFK